MNSIPSSLQALDLKKLQTPLYEEFFNSLNVAVSRNNQDENAPNYLKLPPKSRSPSRVVNGTSTTLVDAANTASPGSCSKRVSNTGGVSIQSLRDVPSAEHEWRDLLVDTEQEPDIPRYVKLSLYFNQIYILIQLYCLLS